LSLQLGLFRGCVEWRILTRFFISVCRYAYSFGAISAGVVFIWGIPALFFYLMWHARNVNVAKQWYVGVCWGVGCTTLDVGCTQVTFKKPNFGTPKVKSGLM
jgi:hypothetical protein